MFQINSLTAASYDCPVERYTASVQRSFPALGLSFTTQFVHELALAVPLNFFNAMELQTFNAQLAEFHGVT